MIKIEKIIDAITGEETIVEREETAEEIALREELEGQELEIAAKATARMDLLERLGLTEEEAKLLLG